MSANSNNRTGRHSSNVLPTCGYCDYYPATEYNKACCHFCVQDHRDHVARREAERVLRAQQEAQVFAEREAERVLAERKFSQMVADSSRKPGISYADVSKNKNKK